MLPAADAEKREHDLGGSRSGRMSVAERDPGYREAVSFNTQFKHSGGHDYVEGDKARRDHLRQRKRVPLE